MNPVILGESLQWAILLALLVLFFRIVMWMGAAIPHDFDTRLRDLEKRMDGDGK